MRDIIENVTIIYKDGGKKICDAISITEKGIYTGYIKLKGNNDDNFIDSGFIPLKYIDKILFISKDGKLKKKKIGSKIKKIKIGRKKI
jgi:hypothetical protein